MKFKKQFVTQTAQDWRKQDKNIIVGENDISASTVHVGERKVRCAQILKS